MQQLNLPGVNPVYRLKVVPDDNPESPRQWDNLGTMVCWHNNYDLGDEQSRLSPAEYRLDMAEQVQPGFTERYETRMDNFASLATDDRERRHEYRELSGSLISKVLDRHYIMLPLYLYDHSGITMSTGAFSCPWDSGQVGFIYVPVAKVKADYNWKVLTAKRRAQIASYLEGEVETYDHYLTGQVYGFVVEKHDGIDWDEEDSCWGFYGDDAEGVHSCVAHYGFTLEQVKDAFADPWYVGSDGSWVQTGEEPASPVEQAA